MKRESLRRGHDGDGRRGWKRSKKGGKERKKERRTRTLCIFNAIRMHRAKNIVEEEEEEGCNFSRHKRTIERELYYQGPDFMNREIIKNIVHFGEMDRRRHSSR